MVKLETRRITEASTSFIVGERIFHLVTEVVTVRSARGKMLTALVSPVALLILEPHDRYAVSLTGEELTVEELLIRVPAQKEKIPG
jgi:hypothetical protein